MFYSLKTLRPLNKGGAVAAACAVGITLGAKPGLAQTITHTGQATPVSVNLLNLATISVGGTGALPASGGNLSTSLVNANVVAVLNTGAATASTVGGAGTVTSSASLLGTNLLPVFGITSALLQADEITANITASIGSTTGGSTITNLRVLGDFVTVTGNDNQVVNFSALAGAGTITLNERVFNGDGSQTRNAVHVRILSGLNVGDVIISSATAGVTAVAVPEPGTLGLLTLGVGALLPALVATRRRRQVSGVAL